MRLSIDPMPALRQAKVDLINAAFNKIANLNLHRDHAHAHKRAIAATVFAGGAHTEEFHAEAGLREMAPANLAQLILSKPNAVARRELYRQKLMIQIERATTPWELNAINVDHEASL